MTGRRAATGRTAFRSRGIALITAIWILAVLMVLVAGFAAMVHSETAIARNFGELNRARWAAQSGLHRAQLEINDRAALPFTDLDGGVQLTLSSEDEGIELDGVAFETVIEDAAGKINLNTASAEVLLTIFTPEVADAIIDWRDTDDTPQPEGAEDEYYTGLTTPYHCKNGPFDTVEELSLVRGVTPDVLDGTMGDSELPLRDLLTVYSTDSNTDAQGQTRINITTVSRDQLAAFTSAVFSMQEVNAIIAQRNAAPFRSPADLLQVPNLSRDKVAQIYDRLTATTARERPGLVNVNTAPAEVLAVLPGMDDAQAQAIVQRRSEEGPFEDVGQVLELTQISNSTFLQVADLLTTRSRTFTLVSRGRTLDGIEQTIRCVARVSAAAGSTGTQILYWNE